MRLFLVLVLWASPLLSVTPAAPPCGGFEKLLAAFPEDLNLTYSDVARFQAMNTELSNHLEQAAKENGWKKLEKSEHGAPVIVLDVKPPTAGQPGYIRLVHGWVDRLSNHFVDSREPRHDSIVVVDETGKHILLDSTDAKDRIYRLPGDATTLHDSKEEPVLEVLRKNGFPELTAREMWNRAAKDLDKLLVARGWTPVSAANKDQLVGKEIIGYETWNGGKNPVQGVVMDTAPYVGRYSDRLPFRKDSPVTGPPPFVAVTIVAADGTTYDQPISAPGKYYVRDLK